jgi:hypothetical protein
MAHATVTVCVAPAPGAPVVDAVARALAPFDMNVDADGRWDRWQIDGLAATPGLPLRADADADPRVLRISEPPDGWLPGRCDGAPRGLLDFGPDRAAAVRELEAEWAAWYEIARHYPPARPVAEFMSRHDADPAGYPLDAARRDHRGQPVLQAYLAARGLDPQRVLWNEASDPIYRFGYDRDWFMRRLVARVVPTAELLRLDGTWVDFGDFSSGMFDEAAHDRYYIAADAYLETLPPDVYVVRVAIHS